MMQKCVCYDENWQLTKCTETLQNGIITEYDYQYDKDGNRSKYVKTVNGEWTECYTYEYNAANQLVSRTNERLWTDNVTYYTYDADGNLISEQTGLFEKTYEYTAENRLAVVKAQGTVLMAALYDGDGNRLFTMDYTGENNDRWDIWIPETGGNANNVDDSAKDAMKELARLVSVRDRRDYTITEYVNDVTRENEEVLAELNPRGKVTTAYTYGYNRESADVNGDTQYYLYDGKGNVDRISSEWGRVKETYNYDPYGNLTYGIPDTVNYYGYNGESSNLATGLQYLRARYYNPQTGSFLTEDTYAGQISNPLTLNRYDYVSNNPVNYIDPSGHSGIGKFISDAWNGFTGFVSDVVDTVVDAGKKAVDTVTGWFEDKDLGKNKDKGKNTDKNKGKDKESDNKVSSSASEIPKNNMDLQDVLEDTVSMQVAAQMERDIAIRESHKKFCEDLAEWAVDNIGNEKSSVLLKKERNRRWGVFFVETGEEMIYVIEEEEIEKFITSYTEFDYHTENKISSGYKVAFGSTIIDVSATLRDLGISVYRANDTFSSGGGFKIDVLELQIGLESFQEYQKDDGVLRVYDYRGGDPLTVAELICILIISYYNSYYDLEMSTVQERYY